MQFFDRAYTPPPAILVTPQADENRRQLRQYFALDDEELSQTGVPYELLQLYDPSILRGLKQLFHGKCAFCESHASVIPYRFRPFSEALPNQSRSSHLYYLWLAEAWENIYSICDKCLPENQLFFPVRGERAPLPNDEDLAKYEEEGNGLWRAYPIPEKPYLLDPCSIKDFYRHFDYTLEGMLKPKTQAAATTANFFSLNDNKRLERRGYVVEGYLRALWDDGITEGSGGLDLARHFDFQELEYGGSWFLLLKKFVLSAGGPNWKMPNKLAATNYFTALLKDPNLRRQFLFNHQWISEPQGNARTGQFKQLLPETRSRISGLEIKDFKGIESLEIDFGQRNFESSKAFDRVPNAVIIGENAAGKSTILEAIALALSPVDQRLALKLSPNDLLLNPRFLGGLPDASPSEGASIRVRFESGRECWLKISPAGFIDNERDDHPIVPPVFAFGAFRQPGKGDSGKSPARYIQSLFQSTYLLPSPEAWLAKLQSPKFEMVARALQYILGIEEEYDVIRPGPGANQCQLVSRTRDPSGKPVETLTPISLTSSGFKSILALTCEIIYGLIGRLGSERQESLAAARAVVLIDEIEAHLHPRWKMQILSGLRKAFPNVTFIVTTHDPLCLRGAEDGEVTLVHRLVDKSRERTSQYVEAVQDLPSITKMTVGQLLTSDFFQLLSSDDPRVERDIADMSHLLAKQRSDAGLSPEEAVSLTMFERDFGISLPLGLSPAQQIVDEAIANFLMQRRGLTQERLRNLREQTKKQIISALNEVVLAQS